MTCRIAIACSDHTLDQYILIPVVKSLMRSLNKRQARVWPIQNPRIQGDGEYFKRMCELLEKYGPIADVVVFVVDLDCEDGQDGRPDRLAKVAAILDGCQSQHRSKAAVVGAVNEAEVWALWGSRHTLGASWQAVRDDCHPKERYFYGLLTAADEMRPDRGRSRLTQVSLSVGWASLKAGCPELASLESAISSILESA